MSELHVMVLGAGQEVGRSCVVINVGDTYVMIDCGMHLGYRDARRFPDFNLLPFSGRLTQMISAVLITHFHLDHCAALPYLTETHGYRGPVFMTHPTKAIMPIMLADYHKVMTGRQGGREWYTQQDIARCMQQAVGLDLNTATQVAPGVEVTALYAGHVLGAAQFHLVIHGRSILYTGDYNTSADRHLGAAQLARLRPHLLISESTYATTLRDSKKSRERSLLSEVIRCVQEGGKVLVPVFAVGRAQELLCLIEDAWQRAGLVGRVPLYLSAAMASAANCLYRAHVNWASQQLRHAGGRATAFTFQHIQPWDPMALHAPGPCVLFASPGMLSGGVSLEVFKAWAPDARNLVVLPGYQVAGTLGGRLMSGQLNEIKLGDTSIAVRCKVRYLSFSAHTDAAGILQLISTAKPHCCMLVHGDKEGMQFMSARITRLLGVPCLYPPVGADWVKVPCQHLPVAITLLPPSSISGAASEGVSQGHHHGPSMQQPEQLATPVEAGPCRDAQKIVRPVHCLDLPLPCTAQLVTGLLTGRQEAGQAVDLKLHVGSSLLGQLRNAFYVQIEGRTPQATVLLRTPH